MWSSMLGAESGTGRAEKKAAETVNATQRGQGTTYHCWGVARSRKPFKQRQDSLTMAHPDDLKTPAHHPINQGDIQKIPAR